MSLLENIVQFWTVWLVVAVAMAILEMVVPNFTFIFASIGAVVAALVSLKLGWEAQLITFGISAIFSLVLLRRRLIAKFHKTPDIPSRSQELLGEKGQVTEAIDPITGKGRVLVAGQDWAAHSKTPIASGKTVTIENHDGIILIVKENP